MKNILPTITLYQPWATWIMREWKTIETREHSRFACLEHRTILIHAGMTTDKSPEAVSNPYLSEEQLIENPNEMVNGFILGSAHVHDFDKLSGMDSKPSLIECEETDRWGLFLEHIKVFDKPIPASGGMGIWYYDLFNKEKVKKPENLLF